MKWYHILIMQSVNMLLSFLPLVIADEEIKAQLKLQLVNLYYAIQRTYPELGGVR